MPDAPAGALAAAERAIIEAASDFGHDDLVCGSSREFARAALEAAAPVLAEAWGVAEREQIREQIRQNNQNLLAAASEYYRLAYPEAVAKEKP